MLNTLLSGGRYYHRSVTHKFRDRPQSQSSNQSLLIFLVKLQFFPHYTQLSDTHNSWSILSDFVLVVVNGIQVLAVLSASWCSRSAVQFLNSLCHTEFRHVSKPPREFSEIVDRTFFSALIFSNFFFLIWIEDQILRFLASLLFRYR